MCHTYSSFSLVPLLPPVYLTPLHMTSLASFPGSCVGGAWERGYLLAYWKQSNTESSKGLELIPPNFLPSVFILELSIFNSRLVDDTTIIV